MKRGIEICARSGDALRLITNLVDAIEQSEHGADALRGLQIKFECLDGYTSRFSFSHRDEK